MRSSIAGAAPIELLDVGMVVRRRQHARDDAALLGHAHALGGAQGFDVSGLRRVHDASPSVRNITAGGWNPSAAVASSRLTRRNASIALSAPDRGAARARSTPCRLVQVISLAAADLPEAGAPVEPAGRHIVLVRPRETRRARRAPRAGADGDRAAAAPAPCRAGRRRPRPTGSPLRRAAIRDRMKPTRLRPTVARWATTLRSSSRRSNLVRRSSRDGTRRRAAPPSRAASREPASDSTGSPRANRRVMNSDHRRGRRAASCGWASGARR